MYQVKDIVKIVTLPHPALGATDECRVLFRHAPAWGYSSRHSVRWVVWQSKGAYVDQPRFVVHRTRRAALDAMQQPLTHVPGDVPVALRPCACDPNGRYFCQKHSRPNN